MKKMMWNAHDDGFGPYINLSKQNQKKTDILIKTRVKGMGGGGTEAEARTARRQERQAPRSRRPRAWARKLQKYIFGKNEEDWQHLVLSEWLARISERLAKPYKRTSLNQQLHV